MNNVSRHLENLKRFLLKVRYRYYDPASKLNAMMNILSLPSEDYFFFMYYQYFSYSGILFMWSSQPPIQIFQLENMARWYRTIHWSLWSRCWINLWLILFCMLHYNHDSNFFARLLFHPIRCASFVYRLSSFSSNRQ